MRPVAVAWAAERVDVFGLETDSALYHRSWNADPTPALRSALSIANASRLSFDRRSTPPMRPPGTRDYRTTLALLVDQVANEDLVLALGRLLTAKTAPERLTSTRAVWQSPGWLELELQLRSSELNDDYDVDTLAQLQVDGDRGATYWTRPAATLLDTTMDAVEILQRALNTELLDFRLDALVLRTTPLGELNRRLGRGACGPA